jgi:hypothetical protein
MTPLPHGAATARGGPKVGGAGLRILRVNPLEHAEEIKVLFLTHERPEFPDYFERAYRDAGAGAVTSWVGRDAAGRLCAHAAQFRRDFRIGRQTVRGALLSNMMVATAYRTFWPAFSIMRRMIADARQAGAVDFLYADPNEPARAVAQAAGFRPLGILRRCVLPLRGRPLVVDLGVRLYHRIGDWRGRGTRLAVTEVGAEQAPGGPGAPAPRDPGSLDPVRDASLYRGRLAGYPGRTDRWYGFHLPGRPRVPVGRALARGPNLQGVASICVLEGVSTGVLTAALAALARRLRRAGARRLELYALDRSRLSSAARRAGFVPREDRIPLVALPLTVLGAEAVRLCPEWRLLPIDLDR